MAKTQSDFTKFILGFPQIVSGNASLVGPITNGSDKNQFYGKRGLTGYWYIEGSKSEEIEKMNFYYAKNQTIWLDLEILVRSFKKMWSNK